MSVRQMIERDVGPAGRASQPTAAKVPRGRHAAPPGGAGVPGADRRLPQHQGRPA